jgi:hypothetical protein
MRFREDTKAYYFSTNYETDSEERSIIYEQTKDYLKGYLHTTFKPADTTGGTVKKFLPIVIFAIAVVLLIIFSINKMIPALIFTFGGVFILFGIAFFLPGNKDEETPELPQHSKVPKAIPGAAIIAFGLGVIVPAVFAPSIGYAKAMAAGCGTWFVLGGLFFIVYTIVGYLRFSKASKNTVQGKCIGYIKQIESSKSDTTNHHRLFIIGTPVFEYTINGIAYQAFQEDNMRIGKLTPYVGDTVELGVMPDDPYAVFYHKNTGAKIFAIVMSVIVLAAGIFVFCMLPSINDNGGFVVNTMGGQTRLAKAKFDDKTIAKYITGDYTIEYVTVTAAYDLDGSPVVELSNGKGLKLKEDERDKYPVGAAVYVVKPVDGSTGLNFRAEEWEYAGSHEVTGLP